MQTQRHIRSFVLRAGRMTPAQERALTELWPSYGVDLDAGPLDLEAIFGRRAPRSLEIGFGVGEVIGSLAEKQLTTPQQYPLTLNALVLACNQSSNRDPVVAYDEEGVVDALSSLKEAGLLRLPSDSPGPPLRLLRMTSKGRMDVEIETTLEGYRRR